MNKKVQFKSNNIDSKKDFQRYSNTLLILDVPQKEI